MNIYYHIRVNKSEVMNVCPRTGRPTSAPKKNQAKVRMTNDELAKLNFCCEKTGKTKTEIINLGIDLVYQQIK